MCHIVATANGGAQAAENVFVWSHEFNEMLGDRNDDVIAAIVAKYKGVEYVKRAMDLSKEFGNVEHGKAHMRRSAETICRAGRVKLDKGKVPEAIHEWWESVNSKKKA